MKKNLLATLLLSLFIPISSFATIPSGNDVTTKPNLYYLTNAQAIDSIPNNITGSAAALLGSLQYGSGIISSFLLVQCAEGTPWPMVWIMRLFVGLSALMAILARSFKH